MNKSLKISIFILFIYTISLHGSFGQIFSGEQNPPSVKFRQINTPSFQIIFPEDLNDDAQRLAAILEVMVEEVARDMKHRPHPISIILQGRSVESNGFVQMAPRRSEFYTMPAQEFDTQDWLNSLAVHELRHVVQFDNLAYGLGAPLFEELKLALFGIQLPAWFFEGDAVLTETLFSPGGRGRQPAFDLVFRTNILSGRSYSYSKNYFGSFRDFTPGYYPLGYFMTTKMRRDGEPDLLPKMFSRISSQPLRPYNFSNSLKKYNGYGTSTLFRRTVSELDSLWQDQSKKLLVKNYAPINEVKERNPASYLFPYQMDEHSWVCLKASKAVTPQIIILKEEKEEKILSIGNQTEANLHYSNGVLVWDEFRADKRYGKQSFNVVCLYDLNSKKFRQLSHRSKLFSPALSADAKKIIAVKVSAGNHFNLVELDAKDGREIRTYPNPKNYTLQTPQFNEDATEVVVTAVNQEGKTLLCYDANSGKYKTLLLPQRQLLSRPTFADSLILFKAHYGGIDNVFSLDTARSEIRQMTFSEFGAYHPSYHRETNQISFNDYQHTGHNANFIDFKPSETTSPSETGDNTVSYFEPLKSNENNKDLFKIPAGQKNLESQPYREAGHLFYFHSLRPLVALNDFPDDMTIGFDMVSDNKLNTLSAYAGYHYNTSMRSNEYRAGFTYQKFYPIFKFEIADQKQLSYALDTTQQQNRAIPFTWRETVSSFSMSLPFFSNQLNRNFNASLDLSTNYTHRYEISEAVNIVQNIAFPLKYSAYLSYATRRSSRDLAPQWGAVLRTSYQHLPLARRLDGRIFSIRSAAYTPGLLANHSFQLNFNWQRNSGVYQYAVDIPRASGYRYFSPVHALSNTFFLNYRFPIFYPDWELGPLAYIKRLKGGLFSDFENLGKDGGLKSYGAHLSADLNVLRFYLPEVETTAKFIIPVENATKNPILELGISLGF